MSNWNDDPLFDRIRALPTVEPGEGLTERVRRQALAQVDQPVGARKIFAAAAVASCALAYLGWAVAFLVLPRL